MKHTLLPHNYSSFILMLSIVLLASCSTQRMALKKGAKPEGIEFTHVENFKGFEAIDLPHSGMGFSKNMNASRKSNLTDEGVFIPGVDYNNTQLIYWSTIGDKEGDIHTQFEIVKKRFIDHRLKNYPEAEVIFDEKKMGDRNVALVKFSQQIKSGSVVYVYGYIIPHDNKAALFMVDALLAKPEGEKAFEDTLDKALRYMIKTVDFQ